MSKSVSAQELGSFIDRSPSPFHVCASVEAQLTRYRYQRVDETQPWPHSAGRYYVIRGASLIAWSTEGARNGAHFRIIGGHTDSPNLRVKQHPDMVVAGFRQVGLEPYGGAWLNSWLDRDLGISGRLVVRNSTTVREHLVSINEPLLRIPQLAIHLSEDRKGVHLDPQRHLNAIWSVASRQTSFVSYVASRYDIDPDAILGFELMTHDVTPSSIIGADESMLSAARLDNQATCFAGTQALLAVSEGSEVGQNIPVLALFDHEEVGSGSASGAESEFLSTVLERIIMSRNGSRDDFLRAMAGSICASGDMAHATHPNYPDRHEPSHRIRINGGPVLKVNQNLRYATDAVGAAAFAVACEEGGVHLQRYVHRADLPCGSTIGPITAARTGVSTVDVGAPMLAMHSSRELMGVNDVEDYAQALAAFLRPSA